MIACVIAPPFMPAMSPPNFVMSFLGSRYCFWMAIGGSMPVIIASLPMPEPLFRSLHLKKRYGNATVVDDVSFEIAPGECLGVIGPNGAGKTTTIRMCLGLTVP